MPCSAMTGASRSEQRRNASVQPTSRQVSPSRTSGARSRSGSWCRWPRVVPLGHRWPLLQASSRSARISSTRSPATWTSSPHIASHSGHVRRCTRRCPPSFLVATVIEPPSSPAVVLTLDNDLRVVDERHALSLVVEAVAHPAAALALLLGGGQWWGVDDVDVAGGGGADHVPAGERRAVGRRTRRGRQRRERVGEALRVTVVDLEGDQPEL